MPPLWPWRRAVRSAARRAEPSTARALAEVEKSLPHSGDEASASIPERGRRVPPVDADAASSARLQAFADVADALVAVSQLQPLVLLLEDLHWADVASLDLLREVAAEVADAAILVIGTHRDMPSPLTSALHDLMRHDRVETLPLTPLTLPDVHRYLTVIGVGDASAEWVAARCGGLPLFLDAAASDARGRADPSYEALTAPIDAGQIAAGWLSQLNSNQRSVIEAAAILEPIIDVGLTAAVAELEAVQVADGLQAAHLAGLVMRATRDLGDGHLRFTHDLWQDAVAEQIPSLRLRDLRRRAAVALEARFADRSGVAAAIAGHWRRAGNDPAACLASARWARRAAQEAWQAMAYPDAAVQLAAAVDALERAAAPDAERAEALIELARAVYLSGNYPDALGHCERAARYAVSSRRVDLIAAAALVVQWVSFPQAAAVLTRLSHAALRMADQPDTPPLSAAPRSRLHAQIAAMAAPSGAVLDAQHHAAIAMDLAQDAGDPQALLDAARARELTMSDPDDAHERLMLGDLAVEQADVLGQPMGGILGHEWRLAAGYRLARLDIVQDAESRLGMIAEHSRLALARWHHLRTLAARASLEGRFDVARIRNAEATAAAAGSGDRTALQMSLAHRHDLAYLRGDTGELHADDLADLTRAPQIPIVVAARAQMLLLYGRPDEARVPYEQMRGILERPVVTVRWAALLVMLVDLAVAFGDAPAAQLIATQLEPYTHHPGASGGPTAYFSGSMQRPYGRALAVTGRREAAETALSLAIRQNIAIGARPHVVVSRLDLAALLFHGRLSDSPAAGPASAASTAMSAHRQEQTRELATQAGDEARRLDMPGPLAHAGRLLAELTAATRYDDPLSRREREVASLVIQALTNRDIAQQLVLSERTVESHVRSILAKYDCANRTELLARLGGPPLPDRA
jgi:DNA-binding NarL/FixJ family response regulator